jgi:hypothetical protein
MPTRRKNPKKDFRKEREFKPYPIVMSPPHLRGEAYKALGTRRVKMIKPGQKFTIGKGKSADIKFPFVRERGFEKDIHGEIWADKNGNLRYRERGNGNPKIGSAVVTFREPLRKRVLRDGTQMPVVENIEHISDGEEIDLSGGNRAIIPGVHSDTVRDKNLKVVTATGNDGNQYAVWRDAENVHSAHNAIYVPLSGARRYNIDGFDTLKNLAEDHVSNVQTRLKMKKGLRKVTTTNPEEFSEVVASERDREKLALSLEILDGSRDVDKIKRLYRLFGMKLPEAFRGVKAPKHE